ncbi:MAG: hypothetical protein ACOCYZ_05340, partial [Halococcoides sp.]
SSLAEFGAITISLAGLIGVAVPIAVYAINDNRFGVVDAQTVIALLPAIAVGHNSQPADP